MWETTSSDYYFKIVKSKKELICQDLLSEVFIPLIQSSQSSLAESTLKSLVDSLLVNKDIQLVKLVLKDFIDMLKEKDLTIEKSRITSNTVDLLLEIKNDDISKYMIDLISPFFQNLDSDFIQYAREILKSALHGFLASPDIIVKCLTDPSKNFRDAVTSDLLGYLQTYLNGFQALNQLFQRPVSDRNHDLILQTFSGHKIENLTSENLQRHLSSDEQLKLFLASEINQIGALKGPEIIQLALVILGQEKVSADDSNDRQKAIELAKEVLDIQIKYLNEEGFIWINNNCEKLLSLSPEAKVFL